MFKGNIESTKAEKFSYSIQNLADELKKIEAIAHDERAETAYVVSIKNLLIAVEFFLDDLEARPNFSRAALEPDDELRRFYFSLSGHYEKLSKLKDIDQFQTILDDYFRARFRLLMHFKEKH